jgi:polyisoprenoid-binding protein YceI
MSKPVSSDPVPATPGPNSNRKLLLVVVAAIAIVGLVGGGYGLWYVLVGPSSLAAVSSAPPALPSGAGAVPTAPGSLDGTWTVNTSLGTITDATASFAGYRVQEQLVGVGGTTAVGRTTKVSGSMTLTGAVVSNVEITADLTALASDNQNRDGQLRREALETNSFPTATFKLTGSIDLGTLPADGTTAKANATGDLTLHGVTKSVTIALQATRQGGIIAVTGSLPIVFADYSIQKPTSFSVLSVDDHGIMELHLLFTHA